MTVVICPGQGAQKVGMGKDLAERFLGLDEQHVFLGFGLFFAWLIVSFRALILSSDYLLLVDADMTVGQRGPLPELDADAYELRHDGEHPSCSHHDRGDCQLTS